MKYTKYIIVLALAVLLLWGVYYIMSRQGEAIRNAATSITSDASKEKKPPPVMYDNAQLQQSLQTITASYPTMDTAVAVQAVGEDITTNVNANVAYVAASTTKVMTAAYALSRVDNSAKKMDDYIAGLTLKEQLTRMIVDSNNTAWYALLEHFGYSKITAFANANGAPSFDAVDNTLTPQDMSQFMNNIHKGTVISASNVTFLEDLMDQSNTGPIELNPEHSNIIRKAGWLEDRMHLTGIISVNGKNVSYAIYTKSVGKTAYSFSKGSAFINEVLTAIKTSLQ